jgi:hypothetical protein
MARRTVSRLTSCSWVSVDSEGSGSSRASSPDSILRRKIPASCTYKGSSAYLSTLSPGTEHNVANVEHVASKAYVCLVGNIANVGNVGYTAGMADTSRHPEGTSPADITNGPVSVALALLEQHWPSCPALEDSIDTRAPVGLERDPRYLIGRLQQALTVLLEQNLPPMDAQTALLSQALGDALAWRTHKGRPCATCEHAGQDFCGPCAADWAQADRYHNLARALGALDDLPTIARACGTASPG